MDAPPTSELAKHTVDWYLWGMCFLGALGFHIATRSQAAKNGDKPLSILSALNIPVDETSSPLKMAVDMLITAAFGAFLVYFLTKPINEQQAVMIGVGYSGALGAVLRKKK